MPRGRARAPGAVIEYDLDALQAALDRAPDNVAARFVRTASGIARETIAAALPTWPVRTGRSKASLHVAARVAGDVLTVGVSSDARGAWGLYAYKIRWSRYTAATLRAKAAEYATRAKSAASREAIIQWRLRTLRQRHGDGAPTPELAAEQPWRRLIRVPMSARAPEVVEALAAGAGPDLSGGGGGRP
jgi:hypothetical protein